MVVVTKQQLYPEDRSQENINDLSLIRKDDDACRNDNPTTTTTHVRNTKKSEPTSTKCIMISSFFLSLPLLQQQLLFAALIIVLKMAINPQIVFMNERGGGGGGGRWFGVEAFVIRHQAVSSTSTHREILLSEYTLTPSMPSSSTSDWLNLINSISSSSSSSTRKRRSHSFQISRRSSMPSSSRLFSSSQLDGGGGGGGCSSSDDDDNNDDDVYSNDEISDMHDLVVRLSLEPTDHERRIKLRDIFHDKLDSGDGRFCRLFDKILTEVGEEIQMNARKRLFEQQEQEQEEASTAEEADGELADMKSPQTNNSVSTEDQEGEVTLQPPREKSPDELQLWALVDMMVQSKTIVKKMSGELGSKGAFR